MALKAVLDDLDSVEEHLRELYTERDGKFYLDVDDSIRDHALITPLQNTLTRYKGFIKTVGEALGGKEVDPQSVDRDIRPLLTKIGEIREAVPEDFDPDEWERLKAEAEARDDDPDNKDVRQQIERAVAAARDQEQAKAARELKRRDDQIAERDEALSAKDAQLRRRIVEDDLTRALVEHGVNKPSFLRAAKALLERDVEVIEEDGEMIARMRADLGGDEITKFVANWVQSDDGKVFVEPAKGGDANGSGRQRFGQPNPWSAEHWNLTEQGRVLRSDRSKAEQMARAAGKQLSA